MTVFTAYFDASGNKRSRILTVAGFVSRLTKWKRFENEWRALLPPTVSMFHMSDFVSSRKGWEEWKGKSKARAALISDLVSCVSRNTNKGFSITIPIKDYNTIDSEYMLHEKLGHPFPFSALACLSQMKKWSARRQVNYRKVLCIFESGDEDIGRMLELTRGEGFNTVPQSKKDIRAFDACDLAAWKAKSIIDDSFVRQLHLEDPGAADRIVSSLDQLELMTQDIGMYSIKSLRAICEQSRVPKRSTIT